MATRLYLPASGTAPASPTISTDWEHPQVTRRPTSKTKGSTALATQAYTPDSVDHIANNDSHHVQFVSTDQLAAQTIAAQAVELAIQGLEPRNSNNMFVTLKIFACSADGTIIRTPPLLDITRDGVEFGTALSSRSLTATTAAVTVSADDRLVFEIGVGGTPTAVGGSPDGHNASLRWGEDGAGGDLTAATDSQTGTTLNPWIEFANNLFSITTQQSIAATAVGVAALSASITFLKTLAATAVGATTLVTALLTSVAISAVSVGGDYPEQRRYLSQDPGRDRHGQPCPDQSCYVL